MSPECTHHVNDRGTNLHMSHMTVRLAIRKEREGSRSPGNPGRDAEESFLTQEGFKLTMLKQLQQQQHTAVHCCCLPSSVVSCFLLVPASILVIAISCHLVGSKCTNDFSTPLTWPCAASGCLSGWLRAPSSLQHWTTSPLLCRCCEGAGIC